MNRDAGEGSSTTDLPPFFSIVVTTRDPRRAPYLADALGSCATQDLDPRRYEIIVASAYPLESSALPASAAPLRVVVDACAYQGGRINAGARAARGRYLVLMDDDDLFERGKLSHLSRVLAEHPGVSYYHHECVLVDPEGRPIEGSTFHRSTARFKGAGYFGEHDAQSQSRQAGRFARAFAFFNPSSIVISRQLAERGAALLQELPTAPDLALFFLAMAVPGAFYLDQEVLTRYRIHPGNESMLTWPDMSLEFRVNVVRAMERIRTQIGSALPPRAVEVLDSMILSGSFGVAVLSGRSNQGEVSRTMWRLLRARRSTDRLTRYSSLIVALTYLLNPPVAQWFVRRFRVRDLMTS